MKDALDRNANQGVSYLLQRVEDYTGLVILAYNFKANIDEAFLHHYDASSNSPFPGFEERVAVWRTSMPANVKFDQRVDLLAMLGEYELTGGKKINAILYACLETIARNSNTIRLYDALKGIRREVEKEGKVFQNVLDNLLELGIIFCALAHHIIDQRTGKVSRSNDAQL